MSEWTIEDLTLGRCAIAEVGQLRPEPTAQAPEPQDLPTDDDLKNELAPFTTDPQAIRWHVARRLFELSEIAARQSSIAHDSKASRDYVALTERLAKVLGLDAPKEVALEITRREPQSARDLTTAELEQIIANAKVINGDSHRVD